MKLARLSTLFENQPTVLKSKADLMLTFSIKEKPTQKSVFGYLHLALPILLITTILAASVIKIAALDVFPLRAFPCCLH